MKSFLNPSVLKDTRLYFFLFWIPSAGCNKVTQWTSYFLVQTIPISTSNENGTNL